MTVTPVAPAAAIAPRAASREAGVVGEARQHRGEEDPARQPRVGDGLDEVQPSPRARHARLEGVVQVVVPDRDGDAEPDRHVPGRLRQQRHIAAEQCAFRQDGEWRARSGECADDARHELVTPLGALIGIGVRPECDVLVRPGRPRELPAQYVDEVRLDHDLAVEVLAGIHLQPFVGPPGEAVVADDAVGDEVARACRDVEHGDVETEWLHAGHAQVSVALDGDALDRAFPPDRRIDEVGEAQVLAETTADPHGLDSIRQPRVFDDGIEAEVNQG